MARVERQRERGKDTSLMASWDNARTLHFTNSDGETNRGFCRAEE
jgi:hypothetical protein